MIQITYISTATRDIVENSVSEILKVSRLNNAAAGVTGLLLYDGRRFLQALEGEEASVERTYRRIKSDTRHRGVVLLSSKAITEKAFGSWAMAAEAVVRPGLSSGDLATQIDELTAGLKDLNLQAHFRSFARVRSAA